MSLTDEVKAYALSVFASLTNDFVLWGADMVGIASVDRFSGAPENLSPQTLLPQTKSVISMAIRHLRGVLYPQREGHNIFYLPSPYPSPQCGEGIIRGY